jgi:hypothetical protein
VCFCFTNTFGIPVSTSSMASSLKGHRLDQISWEFCSSLYARDPPASRLLDAGVEIEYGCIFDSICFLSKTGYTYLVLLQGKALIGWPNMSRTPCLPAVCGALLNSLISRESCNSLQQGQRLISCDKSSCSGIVFKNCSLGRCHII